MNTSASIVEITKALVKFQEEVKDPAKSAINPAFKSKYIPLDDIILAIRPVANKNGLVFMQEVGGNGEVMSVRTRVSHISGEWMESDAVALTPDKPTAQAAMSFLTYMKRYSLSAFTLLASGDPDDDGNEAEKHTKKRIEEKKVDYTPFMDEPVASWPEPMIAEYVFYGVKTASGTQNITVAQCYGAGDKGIAILDKLSAREDLTERDREVAKRASKIISKLSY